MAERKDELETETRGLPSVDVVPVFHLVVVEGPDRGQVVALDGNAPGNLVVGKGPLSDLRLRDTKVSRKHATLGVTGELLRVTDAGSKNGTFVNDVRVFDAVLEPGHVLRVGDTSIRVEAQAPARASRSFETSFTGVIGVSAAMRRLYPLCERLAVSDVPVVIGGETGTGKEALAEALHKRSPRASGPFVVFDCTLVAPTLAESTLFGHERGAFTGAVGSARGVFEQAHGGTLFIDEIGDLDPALQPKLLRALEKGSVQRVGSERWTKVDVRVIAATRRDLDTEMAAGRFRDDLYYRLAVARVDLPPLRERKGDVAVLARHFWRQQGGPEPMPADLIARFEDYPFPGNVRELRNAVSRRIALGDLADGGEVAHPVEVEALQACSDAIERILSQRLPLSESREVLVEEFERRYLQRVLEENDGNATLAANAAGIARRYFQLLRSRLGAG